MRCFGRWSRLRWVFVVLIISLFLSISFIFNYFDQSSLNNSISQKHVHHQLPLCRRHQDVKHKLYILAWTTFFDDSMVQKLEGTAVCPHLNCEFIEDRSRLSESSVVVFHMVDARVYDLPKTRLPEQQFVFFVEESPRSLMQKINLGAFPKAYFNWTMTYRRDSTCYRPYGGLKRSVRQITASELANFTEEMRKIAISKQKLSVWAASNCHTDSRREDLIQQLKKFVSIDIWGACGNASACPKSQERSCDERMAREYKFHFALENSNCADYVSEKFWHRWHLPMVPIILRRATLSGLVPDSAFIAVDDYQDVTALANHLLRLNSNVEAYLKYFNWRPYYEPMDWHNDGFCCLCKRLRDSACMHTSNYVDDIDQWWNLAGRCYDGYKFRRL